ncbi:MAG TPA: HAMP domain-containing sensor histidine kinase [Solirubrobacteraceae bacterium]|jgi:signal transduction histidine kinase|nr:HAMP domain-containing sensor histidine kinase [Solirubrobacteraceae bacterium]
MKTGSLRARVSLTTLALLAIVLAVVVTAVTLAYRAKLDGDLRARLDDAGAAVERAGSAATAKRLLPGLALEGIATRFGGAAVTTPATKAADGQAKAPAIKTHASLLVLDEVLADGTQVIFSASRASIDGAVTNLLLVELLVAGAALVLATLLVLRGTRAALRPLSAVIDTATRIAGGDATLRLKPSRTDTELGSLAAAFDQMLDALAAAIDEARASDAATRRFLADASHELRTPIAALQASVETLLREQPERPERDRLEASVARDSERIGRLVNDLLGLARLEANPHRASIDLASIARPLLEHARARAPQATIALSADGDTTVYGDPDALERVLRNLIDNALAAIEPGGRVELRLGRFNGYIQALVVDDGPGIPEDQRQRIFERFVRLDPSKPGHGLGLAIARRIAHQHDGDLTCDPAPNGASFTLRLPAGI